MHREQVLADLARQTAKALSAFVSSQEWYDEMYSRCGSWDSWAYETLHGRSFATRQPHFSAFIAAGRPFGKITGTVLHQAKQQGRPVCYYDDKNLQIVDRVYCVDANDWKTGYTVVCQGE